MSASTSIFLALASMTGFGLCDFVAKTIVRKASAYRVTLVSQAIGTVPYFVFAFLYDWAIPGTSLLLLIVCSGLLSTFMLFSYYKALSLGKASLVSPISSCMTVVAVVLSVMILGETLTVPQIFLIAVVFLGILLVALQNPSAESSASSLSILLSLVVVFLAGGNTILQKWIAGSGHWMMSFLFTRLAMISFLAMLFPIFGRENSIAGRSTGYVRMMLLGVIDVTSFFAWFVGLREGFVSIVTPIVNSSSVITIILAHIFLNERVLRHQKIGIGTIILGVGLLSAIS